MGIESTLLYLVSLPERLTRAIAASAGGAIYESTLVLLPGWTRDTQVYQTFIGRVLRITVEWAGGVQGVMPPAAVSGGRLAVRKVAGNVIEFTSIFTIGWSPLWILAAAADLTGGTQVYLHALTDELKRVGVLPPEQEITSVDGLLDAIGGTTGVLSRAIDIPPLNADEVQYSAREMREAWQTLRENTPGLPSGDNLRAIGNQMQRTAEREQTSVWAVSSMIGLGAVQAGIRLGQDNIFDYYRTAFDEIGHSGFSSYASRVGRPYLMMAVSHLDPQYETYIERWLKQARMPEPTVASEKRQAL